MSHQFCTALHPEKSPILTKRNETLLFTHIIFTQIKFENVSYNFRHNHFNLSLPYSFRYTKLEKWKFSYNIIYARKIRQCYSVVLWVCHALFEFFSRLALAAAVDVMYVFAFMGMMPLQDSKRIYANNLVQILPVSCERWQRQIKKTFSMMKMIHIRWSERRSRTQTFIYADKLHEKWLQTISIYHFGFWISNTLLPSSRRGVWLFGLVSASPFLEWEFNVIKRVK